MRILRSIVAPSTAFMAVRYPEIPGCSSIRAQVICDELVWDKTIFLQQLAINLSAACLFLLVWTSTSRTSPSASTARHR